MAPPVVGYEDWLSQSAAVCTGVRLVRCEVFRLRLLILFDRIPTAWVDLGVASWRCRRNCKRTLSDILLEESWRRLELFACSLGVAT